jgi:hypothetical protein
MMAVAGKYRDMGTMIEGKIEVRTSPSTPQSPVFTTPKIAQNRLFL